MPPQEILVCAKPSAARRVAGVLRSRGYAVETAGDGTRAVERAERENPAVVLIWSDLRGPETSTVVRRIREASGAKVAVIVKSDAIDRASTFLEAGAQTVIPDARDLDRLARTVDRLLEGGLVVDAIPDLPSVDEFEPEEPTLNGKGGHDHDEADPTPEGASQPEGSLPEGEPGIAFEPCDVAEIVHEAAAEAARGHPSVVVQVTAPSRLPTIGHAAALRGAVRGLVEEACRDSEPASSVTVKAQRVDAGIFVLVSARGARADRPEAGESEAPTGFALARALVALHGGILSAEPIPAGGSRVSFTIPEQPPLLSGMELQGGFRALELLEQAEAAREAEPEPSSEPEPEDEGQLLEQAIDLAAAAADAAALAPEVPAEPDGHSDPIRSLAELFGLEPDVEPVVYVEPVVMEDEPEVEDEPEEATLASSPEAETPTKEAAPEELVIEDLEEEVPPVEIDEISAEATETEPEEPEAEEPEAEEPEAVEPEVEALPVIDLPDEVPEPAATDLELEPSPEPEPEPVPVPEPVPAAEASSAEPTPQPAPPSTSYVADPLHPATAILRALAEEFDDQANGFRGF